MPRRNLRNSAAVLLAALLLAGCQQTEQSPLPPLGSGGPTEVDFSQNNGSGTNGETASPDAILSTDPAAARLQDIGGIMLLYYRDHKQLPATLDDLANSPGGDSLNLAAPRSGREFAYEPNGLWSEAHPDKCIIAYDPNLVGARRWCLLMKPPENGAPLVATVVAIPEPDFRKYHAAGQ